MNFSSKLRNVSDPIYFLLSLDYTAPRYPSAYYSPPDFLFALLLASYSRHARLCTSQSLDWCFDCRTQLRATLLLVRRTLTDQLRVTNCSLQRSRSALLEMRLLEPHSSNHRHIDTKLLQFNQLLLARLAGIAILAPPIWTQTASWAALGATASRSLRPPLR